MEEHTDPRGQMLGLVISATLGLSVKGSPASSIGTPWVLCSPMTRRGFPGIHKNTIENPPIV